MEDEKLEIYISRKENISLTAAREGIQTWVKDTLQRLENMEKVPVTSLGYLYKDKAYKIHFMEQSAENLLTDSFGLSNFHLEQEAVSTYDKQTEKEEETPEPFEVISPPGSFTIKKLLVPIVALLLIVVSIISPYRLVG